MSEAADETLKTYSVLHPFCGLGGGALGLQQSRADHNGLQARFRTLCGIDIDPEACEDFRRLTGAPAVCADIAKMTILELRAATNNEAPDVVFASPPCLPGRGRVLTPLGPQAIETLRAGAKVLTHRGRYRRVLKIGAHQYEGEMISLRLNGTVDAQDFTAEHPILRRKVVRREPDKKRRLGEQAFIPASDIRVGDRIGFPITPEIEGTAERFVSQFGDPQRVVRGGHSKGRYAKSRHEAHQPRVVDLRPYAELPEFWFLLGAYVGDGYRRENRYETIFCVGAEDGSLAAQVRASLKTIGLECWQEGFGSNVKLHVASKHLCALAGLFGGLAHEKDIPAELQMLETPLAQALIEGYRAADGCQEGYRRTARQRLKPRWRLSSVSLPLLRSVQRLLLRTGVFGRVHKSWPGGPQVIEGRKVQSRPRWELSVALEPDKRTVHEFDNDMIWIRVRSVTRRETIERVWNLEVEEDNTFCAPLMATHNCKGFSGLLSNKAAQTEKYQALNRLVFQGIFLILEAFSRRLPKLILLENVPRITSRDLGKQLLVNVKRLLGEYGYVFHEGFHDCGELGGLSQHRKRYLMIARHRGQVPSFIYKPKKRKVLSIGACLEKLPLPDDPTAGPMHTLPRLQWKTAVRLALIPAGKDWRALGTVDDEPAKFNNCFRVVPWDQPSIAVTGGGHPTAGGVTVADPRFPAEHHRGVYKVVRWDDPAATVTGEARASTGAFSVADPRFTGSQGTHVNKYRVERWEAPAHAIIGSDRVGSGAPSVADPRVANARSTAFGVQDWNSPSGTVTGEGYPSNGAFSVADPRAPTSRKGLPPIIISEDGTWHRPLTTLELAAIQDLPWKRLRKKPLAGKAHGRWRQRIGNAVPRRAAKYMGSSVLSGLLRSAAGDTHVLAGGAIWVKRRIAQEIAEAA